MPAGHGSALAKTLVKRLLTKVRETKGRITTTIIPFSPR